MTSHLKYNNRIRITGSYMIAAICNDGIVIGSDSRGSFINGKEVYGYWDSITKIFIVKNCVMSIAGLVGLGKNFLEFYVDEFIQTLGDEKLTPNVCLQKFYQFFQNRYPELLPEMKSLRSFAVGYVGTEPMVCNLNGDTGGCAIGKGVAHAGGSDFGEGQKYDAAYCLSHSCSEVAEHLETAINDYAINQKKTDSVGGPIMIIKLTPNGNIEWLKNKPKKPSWKKTSEFIEDYKNGSVEIFFNSDEGKSIVYKFLGIG